MIPALKHPYHPTHDCSCGGRLVATDGRALPLVGAALTVDAAGGVARVLLEQRFRNPHTEPLAVTYSLPLPADGAVSGFAFVIGGRRIVGEIDARSKARARYEQAIVEGRSAAILEQDRSSLFTQEIGNIPPGAEIVAEVAVDQRLRWLDEGSWEWRFPTVVAPRYLGAPGRVPDAARVAQDVADGPIEARAALRCLVRDPIAGGRRPESPSHAIECAAAEGGVEVTLRAEGGARLDRDVVVRWPAASQGVGLSLDVGRPARGLGGAGDHAAYGLLTVVPPAPEARFRPVARDLIVLLDTSGSMDGEPLAQAVRVVSALVETLREEDQLEMIEFSSAARRWRSAPAAATSAVRRDALAWLRGLRASGSTEMRDGILEAMRWLRPGAQRQVVLVTDGQIGFESQVVAAIGEKLPASSRLHTVGVGSSVNRSLTGPAARAGRGVEVVIGIGEDPERAAWRIVSRTRAPVLVELEIEGPALIDHAPARLPDLFGGAPALIGLSLRPEGGELRVRGRTAAGPWEQRVDVPATAAGDGSEAVVTLYGREVVEDLETRLAAGADRREIDASVERTGLAFRIATRLTSWVAATEEATVDPREALRRERMPHELPSGMSAEGLGLRPAQQGVMGKQSARVSAVAAPVPARAKRKQQVEDLEEERSREAKPVPAARPAARPPMPAVLHVPGAPPPPAQAPMPAAAPPYDAPPVSPAGRIASSYSLPDEDEDAAVDSLSSAAGEAPLASPADEAAPLEEPDDEEAPAAYLAEELDDRTFVPAAPREAERSFEEAAPVEDRGSLLRPEPAQGAPRAAPAPTKARAEVAPEKEKKKGGFVDAVKRIFTGKEKAEEVRKDEAAKAPAEAPRRLRGRVTLSKPDALVIEVTIDGPLDWDPTGPVELALDDGTTLELAVAAALTTRAGRLEAGQIARLCVVLRGMLGAAPRRVALQRGRARILIDLG